MRTKNDQQTATLGIPEREMKQIRTLMKADAKTTRISNALAPVFKEDMLYWDFRGIALEWLGMGSLSERYGMMIERGVDELRRNLSDSHLLEAEYTKRIEALLIRVRNLAASDRKSGLKDIILSKALGRAEAEKLAVKLAHVMFRYYFTMSRIEKAGFAQINDIDDPAKNLESFPEYYTDSHWVLLYLLGYDEGYWEDLFSMKNGASQQKYSLFYDINIGNSITDHFYGYLATMNKITDAETVSKDYVTFIRGLITDANGNLERLRRIE